jgi:thioredoxin 1
MAKDLDSLSESLPIDVKKINIEEEFALVEKYQVMSVPTLVVLKNGEQVGTYIGYKGISDLEGFLKKHI